MIPDQPPIIPTQSHITTLLMTTREIFHYNILTLTPPHLHHPSAKISNRPPGKPTTMINPISPYLHDYENMTNYISDSEDSSAEQALHPNQPIGDTLMPATPETLRIMFQNVNGINLDKDGGDFHSICKDLKTTDTDIMMIAEPNLCHRHYHVKDTLIRTASSNGIKFPKITLSSSQLKYRTYKKPGGTMILTHGKTGARVADQGTDAYGQWLWITISEKLKRITVISLYQVGNSQDYLQAAKKGSKTFRLQLHNMGLNKHRTSTPKDSNCWKTLHSFWKTDKPMENLYYCVEILMRCTKSIPTATK